MNYKKIMVCALLAGSMQQAWGMGLGGGGTVLGNCMGFFFINRALEMCKDRGIKIDHPDFKDLFQQAAALESKNTGPDALFKDENFDIGIQGGHLAVELEKALATYDKNIREEQLRAVRATREANNNNNDNKQE
jgi:hypothetical protein